MTDLLVATANPHKVDEIRAIFQREGLSLRLRSLHDLPHPIPEPAETGATFEANATLKALAYARASGLLALADDSGLEVDALAGRPGVISSHYSTDGRETGLSRAERDRLNNDRVLRELTGVPDAQRSARFVCVMALAAPPALARDLIHSSSAPSRTTGFQPAPPDASSSSRTTGFQPAPPDASSPSRTAGFQPAPSPSFHAFDGRFRVHRGNLPHHEVGGATYFISFSVRSGVLAPAERRIVLDACLYWHRRRYWLHRAVVMPTHVHLLLRPIQLPDGTWPTLGSLLHSIKRHTAREIQQRRDESGPFWQRESFDRIIRDAPELDAAALYIERNPVEARLVDSPGAYPFLWRQPHGEHLSPLPSEGETKERRLETCGPGDDGRVDPAAPGEPRLLHLTRGSFEGRIGVPPHVPRGVNGFGYDPLFLVADDDPPFSRTGAELTSDEKNRLSHRGVAARAMASFLRDLLS